MIQFSSIRAVWKINSPIRFYDLNYSLKVEKIPNEESSSQSSERVHPALEKGLPPELWIWIRSDSELFALAEPEPE
jgi:hypothetical protein